MASRFSPAKLRAIREGFGISQRQLARLSGIHYGTVCRIENDWRDPRVSTLHAFADVLGVTVGDFFDRTPDGAQ